MTDEEWAKDYCARMGWRYLSHETYRTMSSHQVWVACADGAERFEVRLTK